MSVPFNIQVGFVLSPDGQQFAFCKTINNFSYTNPNTILPHGLNPYMQPDAALIYLIKRFVATRDPIVHQAIIHLEPSMSAWERRHFKNYFGEEECVEYSSDSDDDDRDQKSFSEAHQKLALDILQRKQKDSSTVNLSGRLAGIVKKVQYSDLAAGTIMELEKNRQPYFPKISTLWETIPLRFGNWVFQDELELINFAVKTDTLALRRVHRDKQDLVEIRGIYNGEEIRYVLKRQYYFPLFRGNCYLVDRWGRLGKKANRRAPLEFDPVNYAEANIKQIPDFYNFKDYTKIDFDKLGTNAKILKENLLKLKRERAFILETDKDDLLFDNFLDSLQYSFSNGIVNFLKHIDVFNKKFPGILPNDGNPFLPFSHLPFHAALYAFGDKNPYKAFAPRPLWDHNGRARKPHVGKLIINITPLGDFLNLDGPNVVPFLSKFGIATPKVIGAEYEVSFKSFVPKDRIFKSFVVRFPSFHKPYNPKYLAKYGLNGWLYNGFRDCVLQPHLRSDAAELLKTWLCLFHAIKMMEEAVQEINRRQGTMLFFHPDGSLRLEYPSEDYQSDTDATARSKYLGSLWKPFATLVLADSSSYSSASHPATKRNLGVVDASLSSPVRTPLSKAKIKRTVSLGTLSSPATPSPPSKHYQIVSPRALSEELESTFSLFADLSINKDESFVDDSPKQPVWNCFDIAVGIKDRKAMVEYALTGVDTFRHMVAPEIAQAAAATAVYLNQIRTAEEEHKGADELRSTRILQLFEIGQSIKGGATESLLPEVESKGKNERFALQNCILPTGMHNEEVRKLVNEYFDGYQSMIEPVNQCNIALGRTEGTRLSLKELDVLFQNETTRVQHQNTYNLYIKRRNELFKPFEERFNAYCEKPETFKNYVRQYYGDNQGFSFQRCVKPATSMIDVVARMLKSKIVVHSVEANHPIIYSTKGEFSGEVHIDYLGNNHFVKSTQVLFQGLTQVIPFGVMKGSTTLGDKPIGAVISRPRDSQSRLMALGESLAGNTVRSSPSQGSRPAPRQSQEERFI